jgi:probable HAF family extracellular repeat protein
VVVGYSFAGYPGPEAFRWTEREGMIGLGDLPGGEFHSIGEDASGDGSVIVGHSRSGAHDGLAEAFRWTAEEGMVGLGDLPGGQLSSVALGVSADGSVIVGHSISYSGTEAFRWTAQEGMVGLGDLPGAGFRSYAFGVSPDGSIVVGQGASDLGMEAFRWTAQEGMIGLGDIPGGIFQSEARAVSADGSIVVGMGAGPASYNLASIWLADDDQMYDLGHWLTENFGLDLTGWELKAANGISADGLTIVGGGWNPDGQGEAWIAHIPEPSTLCLVAVGALVLAKRQGR